MKLFDRLLTKGAKTNDVENDTHARGDILNKR